jgi:hypothetical protein
MTWKKWRLASACTVQGSPNSVKLGRNKNSGRQCNMVDAAEGDVDQGAARVAGQCLDERRLASACVREEEQSLSGWLVSKSYDSMLGALTYDLSKSLWRPASACTVHQNVLSSMKQKTRQAVQQDLMRLGEMLMIERPVWQASALMNDVLPVPAVRGAKAVSDRL